ASVDLSGYDGVELRVRGSGRTFEVEVDDGTRRGWRRVSRQAPFETTPEWTWVRVPFSALGTSVWGQPVNAAPLDPAKVERFAQSELGMLLDPQQFRDMPQFEDADLCAAGVMLRDALDGDDISSGVMFEAMSRVLLVKLLQRYGKRPPEDVALSSRFTSAHYHRVLAHIRSRLDKTISVDALAREAGMSASHFSRVFKETMGSTPMQYVLAYRIEQAIKMMADPALPLGEVALACGFSDQAHFSRSFKQVTGQTPRQFRAQAA
ncbi:MAG: CIA30 family protein, partial [Pseudomonadota bacterium]